MRHLGTIEGIGRLIADSEDLCECRYRISVYDAGKFKYKTANGTLEANFGKLHEAYIAGAKFAIRLEDRGEVMLDSVGLTEDGATFSVTGPVPGF